MFLLGLLESPHRRRQAPDVVVLWYKGVALRIHFRPFKDHIEGCRRMLVLLQHGLVAELMSIL